MKKMFTKKSCLWALLLVLFTILLSGCTPQGYSSATKKKVYNNNKAAVNEWFANNMPSAKIVSMEAYEKGGNLFNAITGIYKINSNQFTFIYHCEDASMYVSEYNDRIIELLGEGVCDIYGFMPDEIKVEFDEHFIKFTCVNDRGGAYGRPIYGDTVEENELVFPYGSDPEEVAANMLQDESPVASFFVSAFVDQIPEYDPEAIRKIPGLTCISYCCPIDYEYSGITYSCQYKNSAFSYYSNIKKVKDDLYIGYCFREESGINEKGEIEITVNNHSELLTDIIYEETGDKEFKVTLPSDQCELLIFAPKATFLNCYTRSSGEYVEDKIDRDVNTKDKLYQGYVYWYRPRGAFPDSDLICYVSIDNMKSYTIKIE